MNGLVIQVQEALKRDPYADDLFVFRGRSGDLIKIIWHDGLGMSLYAKRLEKGLSSFGRHRLMAWWRFRRRNWHTDSTESTG